MATTEVGFGSSATDKVPVGTSLFLEISSSLKGYISLYLVAIIKRLVHKAHSSLESKSEQNFLGNQPGTQDLDPFYAKKNAPLLIN